MCYSRVDWAVIVAVSEMVTCGVSTRKMERVASSMVVDRMSASQVSRICESLDAAVADLQCRDLSSVSRPCIWADAAYVKCRDGGRVSSCALITAIGAGSATGERFQEISQWAWLVRGVVVGDAVEMQISLIPMRWFCC